jgi:hypothetical protein
MAATTFTLLFCLMVAFRDVVGNETWNHAACSKQPIRRLIRSRLDDVAGDILRTRVVVLHQIINLVL